MSINEIMNVYVRTKTSLLRDILFTISKVLIAVVVILPFYETGIKAFKDGNLGIMDYYKMKNIMADTQMRDSIGTSEDEIK